MILKLLSHSSVEGKTRNWFHHLDESKKEQHTEFHVPSGFNLSTNTDDASQAALWGIEVS